MNIRNGLVSPQFHVQHDNHFDTVSQNKYESTWQLKTGFVDIMTKRKMDKEREEENLPLRKKRSINQTQLEYEQMQIERESHDKIVKEQAISRDERRKQRDKMRCTADIANSEGGNVSNSEGARKATTDNGIDNPGALELNDDIMVGNDETKVLSSIIMDEQGGLGMKYFVLNQYVQIQMDWKGIH